MLGSNLGRKIGYPIIVLGVVAELGRTTNSFISKEDVPTWCKQFYYDFFLINGLYMFRTYKNSWRWTCKCPKHVEAIYEKKIIIKLFASSWYIFLTYIYDARSHLHHNSIISLSLSAWKTSGLTGRIVTNVSVFFENFLEKIRSFISISQE